MDKFVEKATVVVNRRGVHARAAAKLVTVAERFSSRLSIVYGEQEVEALSIMGLLMLGATQGAVLNIRGEGPDADGAVEAVVTLISAGFYEET